MGIREIFELTAAICFHCTATVFIVLGNTMLRGVTTFILVQVDGGWSAWRYTGECSRSCGGGNRMVVRSCTDPHPKNGGRQCTGSGTQNEKCNEKKCPGIII